MNQKLFVFDVHDSGAVTLRRPDECAYTHSSTEAPSTQWDKCGEESSEWFSGTQVVEVIEGDSIWPLREGNRIVYRNTPVSSKGTRGNPEVRTCEVSGPMNIAITSGNSDVMRIRCVIRRPDENIEERNWYWNAEQREVKYTSWRSDKGPLENLEVRL